MLIINYLVKVTPGVILCSTCHYRALPAAVVIVGGGGGGGVLAVRRAVAHRAVGGSSAHTEKPLRFSS